MSEPRPQPRRVLVIANSGLERADLVDTVVALGDALEVLVVAPAPELATVGERIQRLDESRRRLYRALIALVGRVATATGWIAGETDARAALTHALGDFAADDLVLVRGSERGWPEAIELAYALSDEIGVTVTELEETFVASL